MIDKRMQKLLSELEMQENSIYEPDTDKIIKGVKDKIGLSDGKNVRKFKRKSIGVLPAVAILVLMMAITTFALGGEIVVKIIKEAIAPPVETEESTEAAVIKEEAEEVIAPTEEEIETQPEYEKAVFEKYYKEEEKEEEEYEFEQSRNVYDSIEDDNYVLLLNEITGDSEKVNLTITIEAKTEDAKILLSDDKFDWFRLEAFDEEADWYYVESKAEEDEAKRQESSVCYWVNAQKEESGKDFGKMRVTCRAFSPDMEERYIYFEVEKKKTDAVEFDLPAATAGSKIHITEGAVEITKQMEPSYEYAPDARNLNVFFKFKNGTVKTFNQLVKGECSVGYAGGDNLYKFSSSASLNIESLESIIVGDIEYPIDNPDGYTQAYISSSLKPFVVMTEGKRAEGVSYVCTLNNLRACINITDSADGMVEFTYGGNRYRVESGNSIALVNGSERSLSIAPYMDEAGDLWVGEDLLKNLLGISYAEMESEGTYFMVP